MKNNGWVFSRENDVINAENKIMKYTCKIGEIYHPKVGDSDGPKKLIDVSFMGNKWRAATQAVDKGGRDRIMDLSTFCVRYVEGIKKESSRPKLARTDKPKLSENLVLLRIENKIDFLLNSLGVKYNNIDE